MSKTTSRALNLFDLINFYDENLGRLVKSFGCVDYNECMKEFELYIDICKMDIVRDLQTESFPEIEFTPERFFKTLLYSRIRLDNKIVW